MVLKKKYGITVAVFLLTGSMAYSDDIRGKVEKPVEQAIITRQTTQKEDEQWRVVKEKLVYQMEQLQVSVVQLQDQRDTLVKSTDGSRQRVAEKEERLHDIRRIEAEVEPFLGRLIKEIQELPNSGLPFLMGERSKRVERLEAMLHDPEIALSEKFRKSMEALQVEMEYGLTIETYQEQIDLDSTPLLVNVFRLGRVGLYFQSLDHRSCGMYDPLARQWKLLPDVYNHSLQEAIEIAAKRRPAEIITMPLGRMVHQ